ncbi:MAG TPA: STAS/SEC14 domain-containing protein [Anaeromyxobacter sp.]|nr:STAS/SEC14 domain-containing protein [Anaeromyxobacter sp.]
MERIRTIEHAGKEILVFDYGGLDPDGYRQLMKDVIRTLSFRPPASVRTVTIVKGTRFGVGAADDIKAYSAAVRPYVRASAVVGLSALQRVIFHAVRPFLSSTLETFGSVEDAAAWLSQQ